MCICLHISYREYNSVNKKLVSCRISYFIPCKSDACRCLCFLIFCQSRNCKVLIQFILRKFSVIFQILQVLMSEQHSSHLPVQISHTVSVFSSHLLQGSQSLFLFPMHMSRLLEIHHRSRLLYLLQSDFLSKVCFALHFIESQ